MTSKISSSSFRNITSLGLCVFGQNFSKPIITWTDQGSNFTELDRSEKAHSLYYMCISPFLHWNSRWHTWLPFRCSFVLATTRSSFALFQQGSCIMHLQTMFGSSSAMTSAQEKGTPGVWAEQSTPDHSAGNGRLVLCSRNWSEPLKHQAGCWDSVLPVTNITFTSHTLAGISSFIGKYWGGVAALGQNSCLLPV